MLQLTAGKKQYQLPGSWDEAGPDAWQLLRDLVRHPLGEGKARALKRLSRLGWRQWRMLSATQLQTLDQGTPWLAITPHATPFRSSVRVGFNRLHMPLPNFENGSGIGYTLSDEYFDQWVESGSSDDALLLLSTLLCPHNPAGERQPPTSREQVERRAKRLRNLGPEWPAQALMFWMATREYVHATYGDWLFAKKDDDESAAPQGFSLGWWGLWMDIAKDGLFGTVEQVHATGFHELCVYLVKQEESARAQRREMEKTRMRNQR